MTNLKRSEKTILLETTRTSKSSCALVPDTAFLYERVINSVSPAAHQPKAGYPEVVLRVKSHQDSATNKLVTSVPRSTGCPGQGFQPSLGETFYTENR